MDSKCASPGSTPAPPTSVTPSSEKQAPKEEKTETSPEHSASSETKERGEPSSLEKQLDSAIETETARAAAESKSKDAAAAAAAAAAADTSGDTASGDGAGTDGTNARVYGGLQVLGQAVESATLASLRDPPAGEGGGGGGDGATPRRSSTRHRKPTSKVQSAADLGDDEAMALGLGGGDGTTGGGGGSDSKPSSSSGSGTGAKGHGGAGKRKQSGGSSRRGGRGAKGKGKQSPQPKRRRLNLRPPNFEAEQPGGGGIRKRYSLDFKIKVAKYALSKDPNGQAKGGTIGPRYAALQLGIPEAQSVREWMRRLPEMENALSEAAELGGASWSNHMSNKKSFSLGKAPLTIGIEDDLIAYIKEIKSKGEFPVSSRLLKEKAEELSPGVFGIVPHDDPAAMRKHEGKINSWCHRFLRRHRITGINEGPIKRRTFNTSASSAASHASSSSNGAAGVSLSLPQHAQSFVAAGAVGIASAPGSSSSQVPSYSTTATTAHPSLLSTTTTAAAAAAAAAAATNMAASSANNALAAQGSAAAAAAAAAGLSNAGVGGPRIVPATSFLGVPVPAQPVQQGHIAWPTPVATVGSFPIMSGNAVTTAPPLAKDPTTTSNESSSAIATPATEPASMEEQADAEANEEHVDVGTRP